MQHLESAAPPVAHLSSVRWMRVSAAVALCLAGPAVWFAGVLTTGLSGTAAAVGFPPGYGVTLVAAAAIAAAALAALIARRDALAAIPAALGPLVRRGRGREYRRRRAQPSGPGSLGRRRHRRSGHRGSRRPAPGRPPQAGT
jgi:hypothetical protein